jgi:hypothetical protein
MFDMATYYIGAEERSDILYKTRDALLRCVASRLSLKKESNVGASLNQWRSTNTTPKPSTPLTPQQTDITKNTCLSHPSTDR